VLSLIINNKKNKVMEKINRREFIRKSVVGVSAMSLAGMSYAETNAFAVGTTIDTVKLGNTGLTVPRLALGTGTVGYNKMSNQTRLGMSRFVKLAHHAYEKGVRFYDMADMYGSHPYVGEALKTLPREKVILQTKMWTQPDGSNNLESVKDILDRFRKEIGTDYIDIVLMHCINEGSWMENRKHYMEGLQKAKQDGIVKAVGLSCHSWDAMATAINSPWADVLLARINPFQSHMDGKPDDVNELLGKVKANGKGIIGMKIFGEGKNVTETERKKSLRFAIKEANIHCMTIGLESEAQLDDAVEKIMGNVKGEV
jgi:aryl-alcohol dehydrogenase-like predicted oxidoreductase